MARLPVVRDGMLQQPQQSQQLHNADEVSVAVGTPEWFSWLDAARSFTFAGAAGSFTARHEQRSGRQFWYAYRQQEGVLRKTYLGRSADLTLQRLEQAAETLAHPDGAEKPAQEETWPLIATKIAMPQPLPALINRPAIVARCLESIERPCALISAPAGFGKTTLLLMACEELQQRGWKIAWLSLEEADQDTTRFWRYTLAALDATCPGVGASALRLLEMPRPAPIEQVLTALINALATVASPLALVLDDYHRAASPASDDGLTFLIEHAPTTLHLVLTTRADPALPLARLRAQGRLAELHAADLRFSADEAGRFMRDTMRLTLSDDQLARLGEQTEGWAAGLQLAALSLRAQTGALDIPAEVTTTPRYVADYLIAEVLEGQSEEVQAFLLQTSVLERLSGALCDAVTGRTDGAAMLLRLMQAHLFVTPLDAGQVWYRYHHLFAEVLRERLARTAPELLVQCHRRAADWLRQQGMTGEAIRHLIAAEAYDEAAVLIEGESDRLIRYGEMSALEHWGRALPREILLAHPHLCALFTLGLFLQGNSAETTAWLDDLEQHLAQIGEQSANVIGEIATLRAVLLLIAGNATEGAALAREALTQLHPQNQLMRGLALWLNNITGLLGDEDLFESSLRMAEFAEESRQAGNIFMAYMGVATQAGIELYQARLRRAAQTAREALRLIAPTDGPELPIAAMAYCMLGEVKREWNDLAGAEDDLRHALAISGHLRNAEFINDGLISLAMVQAAQGNYDAALATFEELRHLIRTQQLAMWDLFQMEVMRVRVLLAQGNLAEAAHWAETCQRNRQQKPGVLPPLITELEDLALARVALAQGRTEGVIASLEAICESARRTGRLRNRMEAEMLLARARWLAGDQYRAMCDLGGALGLAAPEGIMRVFLDEGEPMADLLDHYTTSYSLYGDQHTHALKLLAAFGRSIAPSALSISITLSPREMEVLRLLALGHSNEQIASEIIVALSTVKWHVANIYRKLGVNGRVQVITRARELHLIA